MSSSRSNGKGEPDPWRVSRTPPPATSKNGANNPNAKLDAMKVRRIHTALARGKRIAQVAEEFGVTYMCVYKIATGATWSGLAPDKRSVSERRRPISPALRERLFLLKRKKNVSNAQLAKAAKLSESSIARAMRDAQLLFAARVQKLFLTSGSHELAMEQYGIDAADAEELIALASRSLPERLKAELEE